VHSPGTWWVRLPGRPAIACARESETRTHEELIAIATRIAAHHDAVDATCNVLSARWPGSTIVVEMDGSVTANRITRRGQMLLETVIP